VNNQRMKTKLSQRQFFFVIIQTQIGVGILSLPYDMHSVAKQDGWISLILAGILLQAVLVVIWWIAKSYPDKDFFQINEAVFSKWLGKGVSILYILYFISVAVLILLLFVRLISLWVLPQTPFWVIAVFMIGVCLYQASSGIIIMARYYTFVSAFLLILVGFMLYALHDARLMYMFPLLHSGWMPVIKGMNEGVLAFFGFIISLVVYSKVDGKPAQKLKTILYAHWFIVFFYIFALLVSFTFFGSEEISYIQQPLLFMLKSFEFPIVARIDLFFISIWMVSVATTLTTYVYMIGLGIMDVFGSQKLPLPTTIAAFLIFIPAFFIGYKMTLVEKVSTWVVYGGYTFSIAFLFIILLISLIRTNFQRGEPS
jgi:spore germination protein (amino acid permease)